MEKAAAGLSRHRRAVRSKVPPAGADRWPRSFFPQWALLDPLPDTSGPRGGGGAPGDTAAVFCKRLLDPGARRGPRGSIIGDMNPAWPEGPPPASGWAGGLFLP